MTWDHSSSFRSSDCTDEQKADTTIYFLGYGDGDDTHLWNYREVDGVTQRSCVFRRNPDKSKTWLWPGGS